MIELDYKLHPPDWLVPDRKRIKDYPFVALETGFVGHQTFVVDGVELGGDSLGIIAFAATLIGAVKRFDKGETESTFHDLESPFEIYFKRVGDKVQISDCLPRGPVTITLAEFKQAVLPYVKRLREGLCKQFPELRENETFLQLLDEHRQAA